MDAAGRQTPGEDVDSAGRVDRTRRENVDEEELFFGNGMHRNVAIVVQERGGETTRLAVAHRRQTRHVHAGGTGRRDDQSADEGAVGQLVRGNAMEIGDDVLIVARQARQGTSKGELSSHAATRPQRQARPRAEMGQAARCKAGTATLAFARHVLASALLSTVLLSPLARAVLRLVPAFVALAPCAIAQSAARRSLPPLELRVDAIDPRSMTSGTLQAGAGVNVPLGYYVRLEIDGAGGVTQHDDLDRASGRADMLARFLLDPFAESTWGFSIGGGMSAFFAEGARGHGYLVVVADLEGPPVGVIVPALQVGLGGGLRVGLVARTRQIGRR
jgi:hypothetical protein